MNRASFRQILSLVREVSRVLLPRKNARSGMPENTALESRIFGQLVDLMKMDLQALRAEYVFKTSPVSISKLKEQLNQEQIASLPPPMLEKPSSSSESDHSGSTVRARLQREPSCSAQKRVAVSQNLDEPDLTKSNDLLKVKLQKKNIIIVTLGIAVAVQLLIMLFWLSGSTKDRKNGHPPAQTAEESTAVNRPKNQNSSQTARTFFNLGVAELRGGNRGAATRFFKMAVLIQPDNPEYKQALSQLNNY